MVCNHFGDQRQAKAGALAFAGNKGVKQVGQDIFPDAGAVILDDNFKWQDDPVLVPGRVRRKPGRNEVERVISPSSLPSSASAAFFTRLRKIWMR